MSRRPEPVIVREPLTRGQLERLRAAAPDGRVQVVLPVHWQRLFGCDPDYMLGYLTTLATGCLLGLDDRGARLAGLLGDELLFEVSFDPARLLADYDALVGEMREVEPDND